MHGLDVHSYLLAAVRWPWGGGRVDDFALAARARKSDASGFPKHAADAGTCSDIVGS